MDTLVNLLHQIIDRLPFHTETDKLAAHDAAEEVRTELDAAPVGRNATPAGVVKPVDPAQEPADPNAEH